MKKQILLLFIFCSILIQAQIQIPQVVGLPSALNSKVDKATGKSLVADTLSAKIQPHVTSLSNPHSVTKAQVGLGNVDNTSDVNKPISTATQTALNAKEPLLPSTPSNPESRFLNGNKQWAEIVLGSGGYASNVYFTNLTSTIVGTYKQTSGTHELTETIASGTCNNNEVLIHTYLFEQPVGITTVDAGVWRVTLNSIIDAAAGDSKFKFVQFKRSAAGVETDMFTVYSNTIENRVGYEGYLNNIFETVQPSFSVDATDRLGCRIYATTTAAGSRTLSYKVGDGFASYLNTPLALRHSQLRDKNGESTYQHLTSAQVAVVNATIGINTGDETLTSIKTKLGAASSVSDGYLTYNMFNIFNGKEPSFTKNTAFNKNFGTTAGTVLEGRTFSNFTESTSLAGSAFTNWNTFNPLSSDDRAIVARVDNSGAIGEPASGIFNWSLYQQGSSGRGSQIALSAYAGGNRMFIRGTNGDSGNFNTWSEVYTTQNLTSSLTTNYLPKWNGSSFVNATAGTDYQLPIALTTNGTSGAATFENGVMNVPNYTQSATGSSYSCTFTNILNTSLSLGLISDYTTVGNVISIAIHGGVSSTSSGKCTFRLSLPTAASPSYKFVVTASDASKTTGRNIFVEATASNYVDVSFLATAAGEIVEFTIVGNGHQ